MLLQSRIGRGQQQISQKGQKSYKRCIGLSVAEKGQEAQACTVASVGEKLQLGSLGESESWGQSDVWENQSLGLNEWASTADSTPFSEQVTTPDSSGVDVSFTNDDTNDIEADTRLESSCKTYVSFDDRGTRPRSLSKEFPVVTFVCEATTVSRRSAWYILAGNVRRFFGMFSRNGRCSRPAVPRRTSRFLQCMSRADDTYQSSLEGRDQQVARLQTLVISEAADRHRAEEENKLLRHRLETLEKMVDVVAVQRTTCSMFLRQALHENQQLVQQVEDLSSKVRSATA